MSLQYWQGRLVVWIDGACQQNHSSNVNNRRAGYGVWFNHNHPWNEWGPVTGVEASNNNAEIEAAIQAIKICAIEGRRFIEIRTDSNFLLKSVTQYLSKWKTRNWRKCNGNQIRNIVKFRELDDIVRDENMNIKWSKVCAHNAVLGNEEADKLARRGARGY